MLESCEHAEAEYTFPSACLGLHRRRESEILMPCEHILMIEQSARHFKACGIGLTTSRGDPRR